MAAGVAACWPRIGAPAFIAALLFGIVLWYSFSVEHGWVRTFFAAALLLPPLPLSWGNSGPHVAIVFAFVGLLVLLLRAGDLQLRWSLLNSAMVLYLAAITFSVGFAAIHSGLAVAANSTIRVGLFAISILLYFGAQQGSRSDSGTLRLLFPVAVVAAATGCLDYWLQLPAPAGYGPQYVWFDSGVYRRAQGFFYESSTLGTLCAFFLAMVAVSATVRRFKGRPGALALCIGCLCFGLALLLSYSRGAMLTALIGVAALLCIERTRWMNPRVLIGSGLCVIGVVAALMWAFPEFTASYQARIAFTVENAFSRPDRVLSGRVEGWSALSEFVTLHPWQTLFGIGYKTLPYTEHLPSGVVADNTYLSALIETGLIGLTAVVLLNAAILRAAWRGARQTDSFYSKWIFCFWIGFAIQMLSGDVLTYWRVLPVFFWVLGQAVRESEDANSTVGSVC